MKKILSCILMLAMLIGIVPMSLAAEENLNSAEIFAQGMGIINNYDRDKTITRAEFASILANLCGLIDEDADKKEWQDSNYTAPKDETADLDIKNRTFYDVDASHPYYAEILAVCQKGYMRGVSENLFAPEYNLAMKDSVRVFINMLGYAQMYEMNTSTPSSIGLLDGITTDLARPATMGDIVKLIYNSLDINIMELKITGGNTANYVESDETFMTAVLKMGKIKGVMTDNGETSFTGPSNIGADEVQVGNVKAKLTEETQYAREYLGHQVDMYYRDIDDEYIVAFVQLGKNDEAVTFDIKNFEGFNNGKISYFDGKKTITEEIDVPAYMIYNGEAKTVFDENTFNFKSGDVTLVATEGSKYDVIIVNCYEFAVVKSRNTNEGVVYNKLKVPGKEDLNSINCTEEKDYEKVIIKSNDGTMLAFSDLAENDVLNIKRNSKDIYITVSRDPVKEFKVIGKGKDDNNRNVITNGENEYIVSDYFDNSTAKTDFVMGGIYTVYLDMFGKVIWAEKADSSESVGILTQVLCNEDDELRFARIYTAAGELKKFDIPEKIKVNGSTKKLEKFVTELQNYYGKAVMYELNDEGQLVKIVLPEAFGTFGDTGWYEIAPEGTYTYNANDNDLSRMMYYVKSKATLFTCPEDAAKYKEEKEFSVNKVVFVDTNTYTAVGYAKDKYSVIPDVIILRENATVGDTAAEGNILLIEKISQGLNIDDEPIKILSGYRIQDKGIKYEELTVNSECVMVQREGGEVDQSGDISVVGPRKVSELSKGDIIRFKLNSQNEIISIRTAYDLDTKKCFSTGAGEEGNANGSTLAGYAWLRSGESVRITKDTSTLPSAVTITDATSVKDNLLAFRVNCPNAILVVETENNKASKIYQGTLDDLITYQDINNSSKTNILVLLTHWSSAMRGAVIYK